jgi:hypothetical protein
MAFCTNITVSGRLLELYEQWTRVSSTHHRNWRRVGSRAATRKTQQQGVSGSTSSPLLFLAGGDNHDLQNNRKRKKQWFLFHSPFQIWSRSSFFPLVFCSVLLQVADLAAEEGALEAGGQSCGCSRAWGVAGDADLRCAEGDGESVAS